MLEANTANELHTQIQYRLIEKLSESERRYRELVENLREIVFKCDRQGHLTFLNRAWTTILGYSIEAVSGQPLADFIDPGDRSAWQHILETLQHETTICEELCFRHQDGAVVWLELSIQASQEPELSGSLINITDRKRAAALLKQANEERQARADQRAMELAQANHELTMALEKLQRTQSQLVQAEKMSSLGQLVAGIAHEINNPVNFIHGNLNYVQNYIQDLMGFIKLYQHHYPDPVAEIQTEAEMIDLEFLQVDLPKMLSSMRMGTDRICQIVQSLRNFSRMDEAEFKSVDIHEGLDSTLMILQHRLKDQPGRPAISVFKDYGQLPQVECYPGQLNQVFMNILVNAIDAIEELNIKQFRQAIRQHPGEITIRTAVLNSQWLQVAISDNGTGIPEAVKQQIFNPFFTTKPVGKGTGMGMSISHQIIAEKHGGKLFCTSTSGTGAEFVIQVPLRQQLYEPSLAIALQQTEPDHAR